MLPIRNEDLETLTSIGLTNREAKVYLALLYAGESSAEVISKWSLVHRQEIYRVVASLREKGLVEVELTTPTAFRAVTAREGFKLLINQKTEEFNEAISKAHQLAKRCGQNNFKNLITSKEVHFTMLSGGDCSRKLQNSLSTARQRVDIVTTYKRFHQLFHDTFEIKNVKKFMKSGVQFRILLNKSEKTKLPDWLIKIAAISTTGFQLRFILNTPCPSLKIIDAKEVFIVVNVDADLGRSSYLWSDGDCLLSLSQSYFEKVWAGAKSFKVHNIPERKVSLHSTPIYGLDKPMR